MAWAERAADGAQQAVQAPGKAPAHLLQPHASVRVERHAAAQPLHICLGMQQSKHRVTPRAARRNGSRPCLLRLCCQDNNTGMGPAITLTCAPALLIIGAQVGEEYICYADRRIQRRPAHALACTR